MKINSRITGLLILTILTFTLINTNTQQTYVLAKEQVTAEKYIEITEQIKTQAENLKESVKDSRINITSANTLIIEGETLLDEAKVLLQKADYTLAFQKAKEAQEKFRQAIQILTASDEQPNEEKKKGILTAINRTADRIQRINDTIDGINITSENQNYINSVRQSLEKAEGNLADAKSALEKKPANISAAANLHSEANKNVEEAFKSLKQIGDWTLTWRSEKFHKGIINQLEKIRDQLDEAEKKGSKINDLRTQLIEAEELTQEAMTKFTTNDKKEGLSLIKEAKEMLEDILKELAKRQRR